MRSRRRQSGFTLLELLVAGFLGSVVLAATYFVFIANSQQYYVQEQIVQMQEGMRFAMEHLKNDLRNAGRLSVVNAIEAVGAPGSEGRDPQVCQMRRNVRAIRLFDDDGGPPGLTQFGNGLRPDRLRMFVDAADATTVSVQRVSNQTVLLAPSAQQLTEDSRELLQSRPRFETAFQPGFFLYVVAQSGESDLVPISSVRFDVGGSTVRLEGQLCPAGAGASMASRCFGGGCLATPVRLVEYAVVGEEDRQDKTNLVRRTVDGRDENEFLPNSSLIIAEYVVNLQVWGSYDTRNALQAGASPVIPEDPDPTDAVGNYEVDGAGRPEENAMNNRPHRLRALNLLLATRTAREDEGFTVAPDRDDLPSARAPADRTWYELSNVPKTGMARVSTMRAVVETPNMYRGR